MRCNVCRREYFAVHECTGDLYMGDVSRPEGGSLVLYYLGEAFRILKLDRLAIRRMEHDQKSLFYSVPIWCLAAALSFLLLDVLASFKKESGLNAAGPVVSVPSALTPAAMLSALMLVQLGVLHLLARAVFDGQGTFVRVLRP